MQTEAFNAPTPAAPHDLATVYRIPVYSVRLVRDRTDKSPVKKIRTPGDAFLYLRDYFAEADRELFVVLFLDTQNQIRGAHTVTVGTLDASLVHPREVFKAAILASAASIILAHNHPSGDPTPSAEDRAVTATLRRAGELVGITILDHVVIGDGRYLSFSEAGLLQ